MELLNKKRNLVAKEKGKVIVKESREIEYTDKEIVEMYRQYKNQEEQLKQALSKKVREQQERGLKDTEEVLNELKPYYAAAMKRETERVKKAVEDAKKQKEKKEAKK